MSQFCNDIDDCDAALDGIIPIAVLMYHDVGSSKKLSSLDPPFQLHSHLATKDDDENILKSF